jgi:hypothetical protein
MIGVDEVTIGKLVVERACAAPFAAGLELGPAHPDIASRPVTAEIAIIDRKELVRIRASVTIEE